MKTKIVFFNASTNGKPPLFIKVEKNEYNKIYSLGSKFPADEKNKHRYDGQWHVKYKPTK